MMLMNIYIFVKYHAFVCIFSRFLLVVGMVTTSVSLPDFRFAFRGGVLCSALPAKSCDE